MFKDEANLHVFDSDSTSMQDSVAVCSITMETSEKSINNINNYLPWRICDNAE